MIAPLLCLGKEHPPSRACPSGRQIALARRASILRISFSIPLTIRSFGLGTGSHPDSHESYRRSKRPLRPHSCDLQITRQGLIPARLLPPRRSHSMRQAAARK
jgi:hypothetical protein